jgi:chemotaxis response regulator CheB
VVSPEASVQRALSRALGKTEHRLVWSASSGAEALRRFETEDADVVLVSLARSDMRPAELTRRLLAKGHCAVVLVADGTGQGLSQVYEAMGVGALDVVSVPPRAAGDSVASCEPLFAKLRTAGRLLGHGSGRMPVAEPVPLAPSSRDQIPFLIALGASTGGPQALLTILSGLPRNLPAAIVIVQHVDSEFSAGLASWLQEGSGIRVELAGPGSAPTLGGALLAGSKDHLVMTAGGTFRYTPDPVELPYRPSVDVLFASLARNWHGPGAAALLTGMGRDGADGLHKLRKIGWHTIAQDEASCVVYGMPKAAVQLGGAIRVLSPPAIAGELAQLVTKKYVSR